MSKRLHRDLNNGYVLGFLTGCALLDVVVCQLIPTLNSRENIFDWILFGPVLGQNTLLRAVASRYISLLKQWEIHFKKLKYETQITYEGWQRDIQKHAKHLKWSVLRK